MLSAAALAGAPIPSLLEALRAVPDPRQRRGQRSGQACLLALAVGALRCDARRRFAIARWGHERAAGAIAGALGGACGRTPSVATLFRSVRDRDVAAFARVRGAWFAAHGVPPQKALALAGKRLRGIHGETVPGGHLVAAYAHAQGVVRAQGGVARSMN